MIHSPTVRGAYTYPFSPSVVAAAATVLTAAAAAAYFLIDRGTLPVGDIDVTADGGRIVLVAAACYAVGALAIPLRRRWLLAAGAVVNALVLLLFVALYRDRPAVLLSPGVVASKTAQVLLEGGLLYLVAAGGRSAPAVFAARALAFVAIAGLWLLTAVIAAASALLVAISFRWGPTPLVPSLALAGGWIALAGALVVGTVRHSRVAWAGAAAGFVLLAAGTVLASQAAAYTPVIAGPDGKPLAGSIAALERVPVNGTEQWVSIRGRSTESPVLLWLAGGPGGSQLATARHHLAPLEERFVVVNWEQPGAGKSYHAARHAALTPERYVTDGIALAEYLRERFGEQKIYVVGESWGSALGVWMAQRRPDLFHAIAGTGQMVDFLDTDLADYEFSLRLAHERGDDAKVAQLEALGRPPYYGPGVSWKQITYLMDGFAYMNADPNIAQDQFDTIQDLLSPEYGLYDKVNWLRGVLDSLNTVYPQLWDVDLRQTATRLEVPAYFLIGRHDVNAPPAIAEDYFRRLEAPRKAWVWFERSGHNPWVSEAERFCAVLGELLLG